MNDHAADRLFERFGIVLDAEIEASILSMIEAGKSLVRTPADGARRAHHLVEVQGSNETAIVEVVLARNGRSIVTALLPGPDAIAAYRAHVIGEDSAAAFTDAQNQAMLPEWRTSCGVKRRRVAMALGITDGILARYEAGEPCPSYVLARAVELLHHDTTSKVDRSIARGRIERAIAANVSGPQHGEPVTPNGLRTEIDSLLARAAALAHRLRDDALAGSIEEARGLARQEVETPT